MVPRSLALAVVGAVALTVTLVVTQEITRGESSQGPVSVTNRLVRLRVVYGYLRRAGISHGSPVAGGAVSATERPRQLTVASQQRANSEWL